MLFKFGIGVFVLVHICRVCYSSENDHKAPVSISNKTHKSIYLPLIDYLKQGYNPLAVPVCDNKTKFHVFMDIWLYQLFDLDEPTQMLTIDVWMEMSWFDCMLTWDPHDFNGLDQITLPAGEIYHPDLIWYQSLHGNFEEGMFLFPQSVARIRSNGMVQLGAQALLKSFCRVDIRLFPYDTQRCNLTFASWNRDASIFNITKKDAGDSKGHSFKNASNGEWEVVEFPLQSKSFCKELEDIIRRQYQNTGISDSSTSLLSINHISEQLLLAALPRKTTSAIGVGASTNGIIPINDLRDGLNYSRNERQLRCKVAAIHRLIDMFSWCNGSQHYVTARVSKDQDRFLIKPFGIFFHEVTASCLIGIDSKGNIKDPGSTVLSADESNWAFHAAIHMCRPDISCLIHLRTFAALSVSGSPKGMLPLSLEALLLGDVAIFVPKSNLSDLDSMGNFNNLRNEISTVLTPNKKILILPNHGIFVGGATVEEAWFLVQRVQTACEIQEALYKLDLDELVLPGKEAQNEMVKCFQNSFEVNVNDKSDDEKISEKYLLKYRIGQMEFEAVMRHLDNSGYRTGYFYQQKDIYRSNITENGLSPVSKYPDVEIPPVCSSSTQISSHYDDGALSSEEVEHKTLSLNREMSESLSKNWFNTPNTYKIDAGSEISSLYDGNQGKLLNSTPDHKQTRWISANPPEKVGLIPHHPVTPGAHITISRTSTSSAPVTPAKLAKGIDPKELKAKQKKVKDRYYFDTNTPGPQSCLLDGLTWEETRRVREEGITKFLGKSSIHGDEPLITSASKGIVQRGHKDKAVVLENIFKPANPFEKVTDDDLIKYREEIDRKNHPELYVEPEIVTSKSETDLVTPVIVEAVKSMPPVSSISLDESSTNQINPMKDTGMTSDSDFPGDSSAAITSVTAPSGGGGTLPGAITSETSAADLSHDDVEKNAETGKPKKKKKLFKSIFSKKKKKKEEKK